MVLIGTAGFSYFDWENIFYPTKNNKLQYYSKFFDIIEINSSFYVIPDLKVSKSLISQVKNNNNFKFILKANKIFTHKRSYNSNELSKFKEFCNSFEDKLHTLLFQFPYSFKNNKRFFDYIEKLKNDFEEYNKAFEFRNKSFVEDSFLNYLRSNSISFVNIDQPQISYSTPFTNMITNEDIAYFRFHGKNYKNWFSENIKPYERYNYLYTYKNIKFFYYKIKEIETKVKDIIIIMNNHYKAKAIINAIEFKLLFEKKDLNTNFTNLNKSFRDNILKHMETTG